MTFCQINYIGIIFGYLILKDFMDLVEEYYKKALSEIEKGVSINKLYQILYEFEKNEEYKACAGILKAIKKKNEISQ